MTDTLVGDMAKAVCYKRDGIIIEKGPGCNPNLVIYITYDHFRDVMYSIVGGVSTVSMEFYQMGTLLGYPVHKVVEDKAGHPRFRIVNLDA